MISVDCAEGHKLAVMLSTSKRPLGHRVTRDGQVAGPRPASCTPASLASSRHRRLLLCVKASGSLGVVEFLEDGRPQHVQGQPARLDLAASTSCSYRSRPALAPSI
jgi:hypothetical protein